MEKTPSIHTCWACLAELKSGQKICASCGNWQNSQKYIGFSNTTLSLLIALFSVISITVPFITTFIQKNIFDAKLFISGSADYKVSNEERVLYLSTVMENIGYGSGVAPTQINCTGDTGVQFSMISNSTDLLLRPNQKRSIEYVALSVFDPEITEANCFFISFSSKILGGASFRLYVGGIIAPEPAALKDE